MTSTYVPDAGDVVWLHFNPQKGHEQAGYRPALVISPRAYNSKTGLMLCCPITTQIKGYPFEVTIAVGKNNVVLADQVKSLDWTARQAIYKGKVTKDELANVKNKIMILIGE